jgi:type II secretory pathway component PulM
MPATVYSHAAPDQRSSGALRRAATPVQRGLGWLLAAGAALLLMVFYSVVSDAVERADMQRLQQHADRERSARCAAVPPSSRELCMLTAAAPAPDALRTTSGSADPALLSARVE